MERIAYLCEPQVGGTYTTFKLLREPLKDYGIDFRCICPFDGRAYVDGPFYGDKGVVYLPFSDDDADEAARIIDEYLRREDIRVLMVLPESYDVTLLLVTALPRTVKCVAHLDMITAGVYRPARRMRAYFDGIIVVSGRQKSDLVKYYGFLEREIAVLIHGVNIEGNSPVPSEFSPLLIGWTGRVDDYIKNVMQIPRIAKELKRRGCCDRFQFHIVGSGPDSRRVEAYINKHSLQNEVILHGAVAYETIFEMISSWNVFLFPSRFEACGFSLLEAMSVGCVPIVSNIRGVFDRIVTDDCGVIVESGRVSDYADAICDLLDNSQKLKEMSCRARERCASHFSVDRMAREYAEYFREIVALPMKEKPEKVLRRRWTIGQSLRRMIPMEMKKQVRNLCQKVGIPL